MHLAEPAAMDFEAQPVLHGPTLCLRPLLPEDQEPLWEAARDPLIWEQHPDKTRYHRAGFLRFFQEALASRGALAVVDRASGRIIGTSRFYDWDAARRELAIGSTFLVRQYWGGAANAEMKQLMLRHAARWAEGIWFHVGTANLRSRRAMDKLGARPMFEGQRPLNGALVDFVYYRIDAADVR
ncbi:MAG TPA: GNAT family N-acetyltransferase [Steroidobacteraceae bacterium]|nr:GNAT family N-acetyltransferase [Steroidobacteraceae bacterium]